MSLPKRYAIEMVVGGRWGMVQPDHELRKDALAVMSELLAKGEAVRGQIHVIELWVV